MPLQGRLDKKPSHVRDMISRSCVFLVWTWTIPGWNPFLWMFGCYSSTAVRQQKRRDRRNRSSIFGLLDRPSPQIADVLPLSMSTPQRSMILDSLAQHHEETCRWARQVCSRYGTAPEASVDDHGAMVSHGHTFDDCRTDCSLSSRHFGMPASRLLQRSTWVMTKQATAVFATSNGSDRMQLLINRSWRKHLLMSYLTWYVICMSASSSMPRSG